MDPCGTAKLPGADIAEKSVDIEKIIFSLMEQ
jgi:hypothetical protein